LRGSEAPFAKPPNALAELRGQESKKPDAQHTAPASAPR
jgi:hypothetical protein